MSDQEPVNIHDEAIRRAEEIGQAAALEVREAEREGCFSPALRDMVHRAEFHKMLRPRRYGGYAIGPYTFSEIVRTVARHNASAAWLVYFTILHEQWVAYLPPEGRQEIYDSDGFTADIFFPVGKVDYVDGGVSLSGQWNFGSGVLWDEWIGLGAIVEVPGFGGPQPCLVTVNTKEIEIVRNWDPFGLRATGSHGVKVESVFVPWRRVLPLGHVKQKNEPLGGDWAREDAPIYRMPFMPSFCLGFSAISVGVAERVVKDTKRRIHERQRVLYGVKDWESPVTQRNVGDLIIKYDGIEALHNRYIQQLEDWAAANTPVVSEAERMRPSAWRASVCHQASELALQALEMMGGSAAYTGDPLEVAARDLFMLRIHVTQLYDDVVLGFGRAEYGLSGHPLV